MTKDENANGIGDKEEFKDIKFDKNQNDQEDDDIKIMNYVYDSRILDKNIICDFGFRNIDNLDKLTKIDIDNLSEKTFKKLNLAHNGLDKIPSRFFKRFPRLENLLILDLSCNQIVYLPNDIELLYNLTYLNLFLNQLRCLPSSLGRLTRLNYLNLNKNPELFKTSYFRILCGPMSNDKECFTCAKNVILWINQVTERRINGLRIENIDKQIIPIRDGHLVQYSPPPEEIFVPKKLTPCDKFRRNSYWFLACVGAAAFVTAGIYYFVIMVYYRIM